MRNQRIGSASRRVLAATFVTLLFAAEANAQTATLVKDIFPGLSSTASLGESFETILGVSGNKAFLNGGGLESGGLWATDGTVAGTRFLLDLPATPGTDVEGLFYFGAVSQERGSLWKTDGTAAGTVFVARFSPDTRIDTKPFRLTRAGSRLFFAVDDGVHGSELWTSDGTAAGTSLVKDVTPGTAGSFDTSTRFVDVAGTLFFTCGYNPGCGLWRSDGSEAGTVRLADLESVSDLVNVNGTLFFTATDPVHGAELWKSDGTAAGTVLVRDIVPGAGSSSPGASVSFGGALTFRLGSDGSTWRSDGTEAGTILVHTFPSYPPLVPSGSTLFTASGSQLRASDGTAAGTVLVRDFGTTFDLYSATTIPGALLFWVDRGVDGLELWKSDGTPAGTNLVEVVEPGNADPSPRGSVTIPGTAIHLVSSTVSTLWRSDGTPAGTYPLQEPVFRPNDGLPVTLTDVNGTLFFSAMDAEHGIELWRSDGTPGGTSLVKDLSPGPANSGLSPIVATASTVFFQACPATTGCELYRTDGTDAGTYLVKEIQPDPGAGQFLWLGLLGELVLVAPDDGEHGREPWRSDGTPEGTWLLGDLTPGPASSQLSGIGELNGESYFVAGNSTTATLWKTDGTAKGTAAVGPLPSWPTAGAVLGGLLVLNLSDPVHGRELWRTDGTAAGTMLVLDINPGGDSSPNRFSRVGDELVFWADDGTHGSELWVTDGTAGGTALLKDINPGPAGSPGLRSTVLGSTAFFWAFDGVHGYEPWKTDGTGPGTLLVRDVAPGPAGSMFVENFAAAGHEVFFTASDHVAGRELWRSDGTEAGTTRVTDLVPGLVGGAIPFYMGMNRTVLARSGGRVFFTATDGATGYELWSVPVPTQLHTVVPCRVADSRDPAGPTGGAPLAAPATLAFQVTGRCGIPATAISVAANVTVVSPSAAGSLSVFAGVPVPTGPGEVSFAAGKTRALHLLPNLGSAGTLSVRPLMPPGSDTHVILDVSGWFE